MSDGTCPDCGDILCDCIPGSAGATDAVQVDLAQAVNLLGQLVDADDCWFDHHGDCQAHGYFDLMGCLCPHQAAKNFLARLETH